MKWQQVMHQIVFHRSLNVHGEYNKQIVLIWSKLGLGSE